MIPSSSGKAASGTLLPLPVFTKYALIIPFTHDGGSAVTRPQVFQEVCILFTATYPSAGQPWIQWFLCQVTILEGEHGAGLSAQTIFRLPNLKLYPTIP